MAIGVRNIRKLLMQNCPEEIVSYEVYSRRNEQDSLHNTIHW